MTWKKLRLMLASIRRSGTIPRRSRSRIRRTVSQAIDKWVKDGRYAEETDVETVSVQMGLAPWMLADYFRDVHGKRFTTWRKEIRLSRAGRLLIERPEIPVCKIGEMVGIRDKSNFRCQFREATGMTPSQWRESHSEAPTPSLFRRFLQG